MVPQETKDSPRYLIQSAANTLEVLLVFGRPPYAFTPSEVALQLGVDRNQAFRCLRTLQHVGFVRADERDRFVLTGLVNQLATAAQPHTSLVGAAKTAMDELSETTEETTHLFALDGNEMVCVDHREGLRQIRLVTDPRRRAPLHAGASPKAALAYLPAARQAEVFAQLPNLPRLTPFTVGTAAELQHEIDQIRARGYAISEFDVDEEAIGVGAPIFGAEGQVVGAISVGGPSSRMTPERVVKLGGMIMASARLISRHLGNNDATSPRATEVTV